jgi:hypothetical protein
MIFLGKISQNSGTRRSLRILSSTPKTSLHTKEKRKKQDSGASNGSNPRQKLRSIFDLDLASSPPNDELDRLSSTNLDTPDNANSSDFRLSSSPIRGLDLLIGTAPHKSPSPSGLKASSSPISSNFIGHASDDNYSLIIIHDYEGIPSSIPRGISSCCGAVLDQANLPSFTDFIRTNWVCFWSLGQYSFSVFQA